jgi:enoyl-[acyl-carrier protein] reductase II
MGSRFIVTQEAPVPPHVKEYIIAKHEGNTLVTDNFTGVRCRVLKNKFAETLTEMGKDGADRWQIMKFGVGKIRKAYVEGDLEWGSVVCGQVCGLIREIPTCRELIESIVEEAEERTRAIAAKILPASEPYPSYSPLEMHAQNTL